MDSLYYVYFVNCFRKILNVVSQHFCGLLAEKSTKLIFAEAAVCRCSAKYLFWKLLLLSLENSSHYLLFWKMSQTKKDWKKKDSVTSVFLEILPIFLERLFFGTVLVDCICFLQFLDYMMSKATPVWFDIFFNNLHHYVNLRKTRVCSYVGRSFMRT